MASFQKITALSGNVLYIFFLFSHFVTNLPLAKTGESRDLHPEFQMSCDKIQLKCFVRTYPQSSH